MLDASPRPFTQFEELARSLATLDVELGVDPRPRVAGFAGDQPLAVIDLRPFPPGGVDRPMVEAIAGLLALGADRLAAALPGRAWSLDDPVVPVTVEADLRQRVLVLTTAAPGGDVRNWLLPFDLDDAGLHWHDPVRSDDECEGWVPGALAVAADAGWTPDPEAAAQQLTRCSDLGHLVMLTDAGAARLPDDAAVGPG